MNILSMFLIWWRGILHQFKVSNSPKITIKPKYGTVFTILRAHEIESCMIAYEVLCGHHSKIQDDLAMTYLKSIADAHSWDFDIFMDIIDEEYTCIFCK